jgi:hypothetical protein
VRRSSDARPFFDGTGFYLDRAAAVAADEVMVMSRGAAGAVQALTLGRVQRIGISLDRQIGERAVHGRKSDGGAAVAKPCVQVLGAHESGGRVERIADSLPLPGVALHGAYCRPVAGNAAVSERTRDRRQPMMRQIR